MQGKGDRNRKRNAVLGGFYTLDAQNVTGV